MEAASRALAQRASALDPCARALVQRAGALAQRDRALDPGSGAPCGAQRPNIQWISRTPQTPHTARTAHAAVKIPAIATRPNTRVGTYGRFTGSRYGEPLTP
jgi:hypothetical protein